MIYLRDKVCSDDFSRFFYGDERLPALAARPGKLSLRNAEFIPQPKGDMNIALQNLRDCDSFSVQYRNAKFIPQPKGDMNITLQYLRDCESFSRVIVYRHQG